MLFNSFTFLGFIIPVMSFYYLLPHRGQNLMLLVASAIFYGSWDYRFLGLLVLTASIDYVIALLLPRTGQEGKRKIWLATSVTANLVILAIFKYFNFFVDSFAGLVGMLGFTVHRPVLEVVLPIGVSFYTFQSIGYVVDVYRRETKPVRDYPTYLLFVMYFPQLVAGPINRAKSLIPQIERRRRITSDLIASGAWLVFWGLVKKVLIADNLAPLVDEMFAPSRIPTGPEALLAVYAFAIQIYCDFSGYTDTARGLAKLMGIEIGLNFSLPYIARSPSDFWRRWHISLSGWLRDYLYIPLGGSRHGTRLTYRNLMLTMLLGGLWHGAAWHFVAWGAYHGLLLVLQRLASRARWTGLVVPLAAMRCNRTFCSTIQALGMFQLTCLGWLLFRVNDLLQARLFLSKIFTDATYSRAAADLILALALFAGVLVAIEAWLQNADDPRLRPGWTGGLGAITVAGLAGLVILFAPPTGRSFIYFQF